MTDHAHRYLAARSLDASPANIAVALRRELRAGRLAELGAHLIPGILRVGTIETGGPDHMAPGCIFARVVLDAPESTWNDEAKKARGDLEALASQHGLILMVAIYRATRWDKWAESLRWSLRWPR